MTPHAGRAVAALRNWIVRHRTKILDLGFILVLIAVACVVAFEVEIFGGEARVTRAQLDLELNELMGLVAVVLAGALFYTWRRAREHVRENARRLEAEREVLNLALHDPLTGLPNRRQFDEAFRRALATVPTAPEAHAVLLLDLNGFKKVNDVHGHPVGDQVLIHVGARLLRAVREGDLVARLGGDEFAILARNVSGSEGASTIALRVIDSLAEPIQTGGLRHAIGTAIGIALSPQDGDGAEELLRKADVALYRAKAERRSALRFFEPAMDARLRERADLERALRSDWAGPAFALQYQPLVGIDGDRVTGFEASAIWRHADLGPITTDRFGAVAEEAGLLADLTDRLLRDACTAAAGWPSDVRLSFSLPGALLADSTFGLRILTGLAATGLSPARLDLEIDEGALIRDLDAAEALLGPLRQAGVAVVAAHFGTGYSDLRNLQKLKLDRIKIDRSFIEAMTRDRKAAVMVKALIGIGQGLDLAVIAEGVGTAEQRAALAAQGCEQAQGPVFGEALDSGAALALVNSDRARLRRA